VVLEQADIETILAQRRMTAHREKNRTRSCLDELLISGDSVCFGLHGQRILEAKVVAVEPYQATLRPLEDRPQESIHKLQFKYAYACDTSKKVRKVMRIDKALSAEPHEPITRPQDRYSISDKLFFKCQTINYP
jgi:hypothetical protein